MKKLLLTLILVFNLCKESKAQTYVLIPDANFATYLQGLIPSAMSGNSLNITSTLVTTSTQSIIVNNLGISNLSGVQYFTSLTWLRCSGNSLTSLPALPNTLTYLDCGFNSLTSLPALPNSLTGMRSNNNSLTSLPTLPSSLIILYCNNNSLTSLPTLPSSLTQLYCHTNSLTSLPALPSSLAQLYSHMNNIKCFPVFPSSIVGMNISPNPYDCLPNYVLPAMNSYTNTPLCVAGNTNGCSVVGVKELSSNIEFTTVYPNPATNILNIRTEGKSIDSYLIMDVLGRKVLELKENTTQINIEGLPKGIYQLLITSEGKSYTSKFIKE
jgi:hypothetical protein